MSKSNIAAAINAAHDRASKARKEAVAAAADCGRLLIEAKATVKHGGWDDWLREHCPFSARTAQLYMKLARYLEGGDPAKAQRVADLSLRDAAQAIAERKPGTPESCAKAAAETLAEFLPADQFARITDIIRSTRLSGPDIARAMDAFEHEGGAK